MTDPNQIKSERQFEYQEFSNSFDDADIVGYTAKNVTIATETPVTKTFGEEYLVVTEEAISNWESISQSGLPLMEFHRSNERALGRVENLRVVDGVLKGDCEFDSNYALAMEYFRSVKERKKIDVSISMLRDKFEATRLGQSMSSTHQVLQWSPYDVSIVGHGSDPNCGFRSAVDAEPEATRVTIDKKPDQDSAKMTKETAKNVAATDTAGANSISSERAFVNGVYKHAAKYNIDNSTAAGWIDEGLTMEEITSRTLEAVSERGAVDPTPVNFKPAAPTQIRFNDSVPAEPQGSAKYNDGNTLYSLRGALDAAISSRKGSKNLSNEAALALEVSNYLGGDDEKMRVPYSVLSERAFEFGGANAGQPITPEIVRNDKWTEYLYANTVAGRAGVEMETSFTANSVFPVEATSVSAAHIGTESTAITASEMTTSNVQVTPHTIAALTKETNLSKAVLPGIQSRLQRQMNKQLLVGIDNATLIGGGSNEPTGIAATAGVNTHNTTKVFLSLDDIRDMATQIKNENVTDQISVIAPWDVINYWRKLKAGGGSNLPLWTENADRISVDQIPGYIDGMPVYGSTNLKSGAAANDHRVLVGAFSNAMVGFFGEGMEFAIGLDGDDFSKNRYSLRLVAYYDVGVLRPAAFKTVSGIKVK